MQKQVGHRIRELREARSLTQEQVAEKAGINGKYFGGLERGEANLTLSTIDKIATALDVPVTELFAGVGGVPGNDQDEILRLVKAIVDQGDEAKVVRLRVFLEKVFR